jgi:hypothetical protein
MREDRLGLKRPSGNFSFDFPTHISHPHITSRLREPQPCECKVSGNLLS